MVTYQAPHPASLPCPHADLNWCYASDLSGLIAARAPDLWVHGHVHARLDYCVGVTRTVCNPRGHADEASSCDFDPSLVIDLAPVIADGTGARIAGGGLAMLDDLKNAA